MDVSTIAVLIPAVMGAVGTAIGGAIALQKWAKAEAKKELLQEQASSTIRTLESANDNLETENADLVAENKRLWVLVQERSS